MNKRTSIVAATLALAFAAWAPGALALCEGCGLLMKLEDVKADGKEPAAVSAAPGEKKMSAKQKATVKMEDGKTRTVMLSEPTTFKVGDKVKVVGNGLAPQQ
jgi:hypothetical protein